MSQQFKIDWSAVSLLEQGLLGAARFSSVTAEGVVGAALLKARSADEVVDHVVQALLQRLPQERGQSGENLHPTFARLSRVERTLLLLLHRVRWDYSRVARLLGLEGSEVEELAWSVRLRVAYAPDAPVRLAHPTGSPVRGVSCPDYVPARPWTQRWLDLRILGREKAFLQAHLEKCEACRGALVRAREIYYAVERVIPVSASQESRNRQLNRLFLRTRYLQNPTEQSIGGAVADGLTEILSRPRVIGGALLLIFGIAVLTRWRGF